MICMRNTLARESGRDDERRRAELLRRLQALADSLQEFAVLRRIDNASPRLDYDTGQLEPSLVESVSNRVDVLVAPQVKFSAVEPGRFCSANSVPHFRMLGGENPFDAWR